MVVQPPQWALLGALWALCGVKGVAEGFFFCPQIGPAAPLWAWGGEPFSPVGGALPKGQMFQNR